MTEEQKLNEDFALSAIKGHNFRDYLLFAINVLGGQERVAQAVGVTQQAVSAWLQNRIPLKHAITLDKLSQGEIKKELLRPDYF